MLDSVAQVHAGQENTDACWTLEHACLVEEYRCIPEFNRCMLDRLVIQ